MNVVVNVVYFFVFFVGSVECRRCFEGVLSSDTILEDCIMNRQSFSFFRQGFRPFTGSADNVESTSLF